MRKDLIGKLIFGVGGALVLLMLGVWQLQRLQWKNDLIARAEAGLAAAPAPLPASYKIGQDSFLRTAVTGRYTGEEAYVLASRQADGSGADGPGFRVVAVFETGDKRRILVDRGYVPEKKKDPATRPESLREGAQSVTGLLRWPGAPGFFVPNPRPAEKLWFSRNVASIAEAMKTEPIYLSAEDEDPQALPIAESLKIALPNDHLQYAITWFLMAIGWATMAFFWIRRKGSV